MFVSVLLLAICYDAVPCAVCSHYVWFCFPSCAKASISFIRIRTTLDPMLSCKGFRLRCYLAHGLAADCRVKGFGMRLLPWGFGFMAC